MALIGNDCRWFFSGQCRKGDHCQYRHCDEALGSDVVCPAWLDASCYLPHCPYRHAHLEPGPNMAPGWGEYGFQPPATAVRSSLVSVPIVGGNDRVEEAWCPGPPEPAYYDDYREPYVSSTGQASVIITPRHMDLIPPQVQPVVVRIGANDEDTSDSDQSEVGRTNLTTIRRVDTDEIPQNGGPAEDIPRVVVEKEKEENIEEQKKEVEEEKKEEDSSVDEAEEEEEDGEEEEEEEEVEEGSEEAESGKSGNESSDDTSSKSSGQKEEDQVEPELDLFDEEDTDVLGVVEKTPVSVKTRRHDKPENRASRDERRRERRERRHKEKRKRSPIDNRRNQPRNQNNDQSTVTREAPPTATEKSESSESKEPVEVMSLEEIMRQKALQSMIERRKQKEAEKAKQEVTETTKSPEPVKRDSPRRPENRDPERRWSPARNRPFRRSPTRRWSPDRWRPRRRNDFDRWRRDRDDPQNLSLLNAQSELMRKMSLLTGASLLGTPDLKQQKRALKRQLKRLDKAINKDGSESDSSSSSSSDSDSSEDRRKKRKHRKKGKSKRKKSRKSRRRSTERSEGNVEEHYEDDYEYSPVRVDEQNVGEAADVVVNIDDGGVTEAVGEAVEEKQVPVKVVGRTIQLKKKQTAENVIAEPVVKRAIAERAAAKKADDEATKLMLQKIRETARNEARKVVVASAVSKPVQSESMKSELRTEPVHEEPAIKATPGGRIFLVGSTKPADNQSTADSSDVTSADVGKRRIIRRQPVGVYQPPNVKRQPNGDSLDSSDFRSQLDKLREDKDKPKRPLTPDFTPDAGSIKKIASQPTSNTKFELGVKTFAEIMQEKRARKAKELEAKRLAAEGGTVPSKPKINRPSVMERLSLPKESLKRSITTPAPMGARTLQSYEDDWLEEPKAGPVEGLLCETKRRNLTSITSDTSSVKRSKTEPARKLGTVIPAKSKSEEIVSKSKEESILMNIDVNSGVADKDDVNKDVVAEEKAKVEPVKEEPKQNAATVEVQPAMRVRSSSARKSESHSYMDELNLLLSDVEDDTAEEPNKNLVTDDDDALLMELDELLS